MPEVDNITFSRFATVNAPPNIQEDMEFHEFVEWCNDPQEVPNWDKDNPDELQTLKSTVFPGCSPWLFKDPDGGKGKGNLLSTNMVWIDGDDMPLPFFQEPLELMGYRHVIFPSASGVSNNEKFRVIVFFDTPATSKSEYDHRYRWVCENLFGKVVGSLTIIAFPPVCPKGEEHLWRVYAQDGALIESDQISSPELEPEPDAPLTDEDGFFNRNPNPMPLEELQSRLNATPYDKILDHCEQDRDRAYEWWRKLVIGIGAEYSGWPTDPLPLVLDWAENHVPDRHRNLEEGDYPRLIALGESNPVKSNGASIASLKMLSDACGYEPPISEYTFGPWTPLQPEFITEPPPPIDWLIQGFINTNVPTMITGIGSVGKSFLTMQMAYALSHGKPFCGMEVPTPRPVFYFNGEDSTNKFRRRMQSYDMPITSDLLFYRGADHKHHKLSTNLVDELVSKIEAMNLPCPPVLIFDPLRRFFEGDTSNPEQAETYRSFTYDLCRRTGGTVIDIHHETKVRGLEQATESRQGGHVGIGSTVLFDRARQTLSMRVANSAEATAMGCPPDATVVERMKYVVLEHTKPDEGEIVANIYFRRGYGGVLVEVDMEDARLARIEDAEEFFKVDPVEHEARQTFVDRVRRNPPRVSDLRGNREARLVYMQAAYATEATLLQWLNFGVAAGYWEVKPRAGIVPC